ncbi:voltage-gated potassium channel [Neocallimastix sp. 'constans']
MATEIDILNSDINEQTNYNSINNNREDLIQNNKNNIGNGNNNNNITPNPLSISKSREKRMTKLLIVGLILPFSVLLNIQSSEIPAWYKKKTKEPIYFPSSVVWVRIFGQFAGTIATIALLLKSVHIGSSFTILKWRLYKKHRGVIMIIGAIVQCLCSMFILFYYYENYCNYSNDYVPAGEVSYFTISSIVLSFFSAVLLSKDANKRNRIFRQSGQKPKNRLSYMQRQLIVLEIVVILYIIIGGLIYSNLEGWTFNDAVYFSIITLMTCGTGDYSPNSFAGRLILIIYAIPGILLTAYTVYSIYSVISEIIYAKVYKDFTRFINVSNDIFFQNLLKHDKTNANSNENKNNTQNPTQLSIGNGNNDHEINVPSTSVNDKLSECNDDLGFTTFDSITDSNIYEEPSSYLDKKNNNISTSDDSNNNEYVSILANPAVYSSSNEDESVSENSELGQLIHHHRNNKDKNAPIYSTIGPNMSSIVSPVQLPQKNYSSILSDYHRYSRYGYSYYSSEDIENKTSLLNQSSFSNEVDGGSNNHSRRKTFMLARRNTFNINQSNVQEMQIYSNSDKEIEIDTEKVLKQTHDLNIRQLKLSLGVLILIIVVFSIIYSWIEHWTFFEAVYFCFVNLCTIGYGDFVPKTIYGKSIYIFFIYVAVPSTTWLGTVLFELATGRWEVYIEKTDLEDELMKNNFDHRNMKGRNNRSDNDKGRNKLKRRNKGKRKKLEN